MKKYRRLSHNEREEITVLINRGKSIRQVACWLGRSHTSLSRELRRNEGRKKYRPWKAHEQALENRRTSHRRPLKIGLNSGLQRRIENELKTGWSPEIIAALLRGEKGSTLVCTETIYQWIYKQSRSSIKHLVRHHSRRRPRHARPWPNRLIPQRVSIQERPLNVNLRQVPGHWEADLIVGPGTAALQVLVERQTRYVRIQKIPNRTAQAAYDALCFLFSSVHPSLRGSVTYDNGLENLLHADINQRFGLRSFFCEPYHAWEKGSVENTNGLIRRFLPKGTDLATIPPRRIQFIEDWLNNRPRKCLNFNSSADVLRQLVR